MLIESVPNVSEGRNREFVDELASALGTISGLLLLDRSADPSHNRSVYTMAGEAGAIRDGILRMFELAIPRLDLRTHRGVHPRVGAVDVVPLIPLEGSTMAECVELARVLAASVAERFDLPVFLYEQSATRPERRHLENIRRGQAEGLARKMMVPEWAPDFGPSSPHPTAGATIIGARMPLIAFNVNLDSRDIHAAREIAAAVRESSGGLPYVKALGLMLDHRGVVQVSMNLTDYTRTPVQAAFDEVARHAEARGIEVLESELIGLIPKAALAATTAQRLKLRGFKDDQVLETRVAMRMAGR